MSDLIKREDAIDAIECVTWYHQNSNKDMVSGANSDEHQAWYKAEDIYDALEAIPSADRQQEWIPCSERLPSNDDWVIASVLDEAGDTPYSYSDFGWYFERAKCWIIESEQRTDVVAWMPIPKPWEGADDE